MFTPQLQQHRQAECFYSVTLTSSFPEQTSGLTCVRSPWARSWGVGFCSVFKLVGQTIGPLPVADFAKHMRRSCQTACKLGALFQVLCTLERAAPRPQNAGMRAARWSPQGSRCAWQRHLAEVSGRGRRRLRNRMARKSGDTNERNVRNVRRTPDCMLLLQTLQPLFAVDSSTQSSVQNIMTV